MSLLKNALESVEMGVEDFKNPDPRRAASAVRNLFAGVLLLLKEKLRLLSPPGTGDILLYQRWRPTRTGGTVALVAKGTNTVGVDEIVERFKDLGLALDARRLHQVRDIRNDVEHHASNHTEAKVREAVAKAFVLVVAVLEDHLELRPHEVLSQSAWNAMLAEAETYKRLEDRCRRSIDAIADVPPWAADILDAVDCASCGSELVEAAEESYFNTCFTCAVCGEVSELGCAVEAALGPTKAASDYEAATQGGEPAIGTCPSCGLDTFLIEEDICAGCGDGRHYKECLRCGETLGLDEQDSGLCSYCDHMHDKLMRE